MAQQFQLPNGRNIDYAVYGPKDGLPLIWLHGTPSGYLPPPDLVALCEDKGIRIISASRAGYGHSTRNKGRRVVDAVADVQALNEHLGVGRCVVGGWSGGGPHTLACAARLPGCVAALCIAGVAPYDAEGLDFLAGQGEGNIEEFTAALQGEEELEKFCAQMRGNILNTDVAGVIDSMSTLLPPIDKKALLESKTLGQYLVDSFAEGLKVNADGWVDDDLAFIQPWGFDLSEIKVPVLLYAGTEDKMVPYAHAQWLASRLPQENLKKHLMEGHGHISLFVGRTDKVIDEVLEVVKP
ncbi:Alpha/Beta hydrolase protein [Xylogone sp. PMI_703]|nr:Alpha/Beta hydrolase protein [Xylogone sp. PMI_703]